MVKLSNLPMDTALLLEDGEEVYTKADILSEYIDTGELGERRVYVADPSTVGFCLKDALESIGEEMHDEWLEHVMWRMEKMGVDIAAIESQINAVLDKEPTYYQGEEVEVDVRAPTGAESGKPEQG